MNANAWDYQDRAQPLNQATPWLLAVDQKLLRPDDAYLVREMLWMWYHHAVSCALFRHFDKAAAKMFVREAMSHQNIDCPNRITMLFYILLIDDDVDAARRWIDGMPLKVPVGPDKTLVDNVEIASAREVIRDYLLIYGASPRS